MTSNVIFTHGSVKKNSKMQLGTRARATWWSPKSIIAHLPQNSRRKFVCIMWNAADFKQPTTDSSDEPNSWNATVRLWVPQNAGNVLINWATISFPKRTLIYRIWWHRLNLLTLSLHIQPFVQTDFPYFVAAYWTYLLTVWHNAICNLWLSLLN